ncbi:sterol desaturase family protein [Olivibacter sitiensis]|uniref:sterol desaturase family protein n=1 Tax=Olivibacter sitiensis TaxID=376470 RepID=UPI00042A0309|nr:sterol desaturase family protein [Olivibacter sitiensis]
MELNYIALGIPAILLIIWIEYFYSKKANKVGVFKYESTVANLSVGIADRLFDLFFSAIFYSVYYYVYEHFHLFEIGKQWYVWIFLLLATDLVWYWYHRLGHEINFFWAAHIVHHQSEEFNYSAAARITLFQAFIRTVFWSILPLVGFHPDMVIPILLLHGVYSFFTHTRMIGKLGWIEKIMVTPSHHRVHHAANEKYLDKNYGDIFIFWDKLFGTYVEEEEEPTYGIVHPLTSYGFLWAHFHYYMEIWVAMGREKKWKNKLKLLFGGPESMNPRIRPILERRLRIYQNKLPMSSTYKSYINIQLALALIVLFFTVLLYKYMDGVSFVFICVLLVLTLINCGALLDHKSYAYYIELTRMFLTFLFLDYLIQGYWLSLSFLAAFAIVSIFYPIKGKYSEWVVGEQEKYA